MAIENIHYDCRVTDEDHVGESADMVQQFADNGWMDNCCTICGWAINTDVHVWTDYKYCPNCGAKFINQFKWLKKYKG